MSGFTPVSLDRARRASSYSDETALTPEQDYYYSHRESMDTDAVSVKSLDLVCARGGIYIPEGQECGERGWEGVRACCAR